MVMFSCMEESWALTGLGTAASNCGLVKDSQAYCIQLRLEKKTVPILLVSRAVLRVMF